MKADDCEKRSIEELCAPLSARVMPKSAMARLGPTGKDGHALQSQRNLKRQGTGARRTKEAS
jgi:hypothetical protein